MSPSIYFRNRKILIIFKVPYNKSSNDLTWIWNCAYIISMLLYNILLCKKISFNNLKFFVLVTSVDSLTYNTPSLLKLLFSLLFIPHGSMIYQKMQNFKMNKNFIYDFLWEFNSFRVIFKKLFKMNVFFRGARKKDFLGFNQLGPNRWVLGH